ncbi:MAG: VCBS repeat-containing protein [Bacteroidota bacterium]
MRLLNLCTLFFLLSCSGPSIVEDREPQLFTLLGPDETGVDFVNQLDYRRDFNIYTYRNFYNGGGVAVGDVNKDGLMDLYFTANMHPNKLYLNKGNFQFEDITEQAGVGGTRGWSTGVTMADVNGDGWLDIYVCNSGDVEGDNKQNELFINNGKPDALSFTDKAEAYGIADQGYGTHASFFDYDKDGDLDLYLLNNSFRSIFDFNLEKKQRPIRDELGGDKFFRNDRGHFTDISEAAGIYGSEIGFGLGITVGDVNRDGWLDMFVSNDFFERDYLYMNNGDGTFTEDLENQIQSLSVASMGADMADINNDGLPEIFVTEMLPEGEERFKTKMTFENWDRYSYNVDNGYYHQFTRNVMQLNNGDGTFSEIGRLAGIEATDWSWGALMADYDLDGRKDLYIVNGLRKDIIDQDYINFVSNEEFVKQIVSDQGVDYQKLIDTIPSTRISNYMYRNEGNLAFRNLAKDWGLSTPSHSNGSVYADFDNDGDLDLAVNNVDMPAFIYRNEADSVLQNHHYLKLELHGADQNTYAIGTNITLKIQGETSYLENIPIRGFQSSVDYRPNFGLGKHTTVDSVIIRWPNDAVSILTHVQADQTLVVTQESGRMNHEAEDSDLPGKTLFVERTEELDWGYVHEENQFVDFDRDRLLYHMMSTEGPKIAKGDINGDGREDLFIGGAANRPGELLLQEVGGVFVSTNTDLFEQARASEDQDCLFFDADNDGDLDLYVARGGSEFLFNTNILNDQLYLNNGRGRFSRSPQFLPSFQPENGSCVAAGDYDQDGDLDLFVGTRSISGHYGTSVNGYILNNNGQGQFSNVSKEVAPELEGLGMITDVMWMDVDQDTDLDLIVIGEWMPITFLENRQGRFHKAELIAGKRPTEGWWNCMKAGDFDQDGDLDLVLGNHGLNSRFAADPEHPLLLHINDFDQNGTPDPIISQYFGDKAYPLPLRHDLVMQLPSLKKKYLKYATYKGQTVEDMFTEEELKNTEIKKVHHLASSLLVNQGNGSFRLQDLPIEAQFSPTYGLLVEDVDKDGHLDILLGGNLFGVKPEVGRYDAQYGLMLRGRGDMTFEPVGAGQSGFTIKGETRDMVSVQVDDKRFVLVAKNDDHMQVFEF